MMQPLSEEERRAYIEARFMDNVREARENGYELVCSECGCGVYDDSDMHETGCSLDPEKNA